MLAMLTSTRRNRSRLSHLNGADHALWSEWRGFRGDRRLVAAFSTM
jgi:hypothetical protein